MTRTCAEIQNNAAALALLDASDDERRAAEAHAESCPACAAALSEGRKLAELLGSLPESTPSRETLERAAAPIGADLRTTRHQAGLAIVIGTLVGWGAILGLCRPGVDLARWLQAGIAASVAVLGGRLALRYGGRLVVAAIIASGLFALAVGSDGPFVPLAGLHCIFIELVVTAIALVPTLFVLTRRGQPTRIGFVAGMAAAAACAGHAALDLVCAARISLPHLLAFHTGGVLLAALLGAALAEVPAWRRGGAG